MTVPTHPAATNHLPAFITAPGETDILMIVLGVILLGVILGFGILFLTLHTLPERIAHKSHKLQLEIVAVLGLLALFTHLHIFWVAGLLLALIDIPDIGSWLRKIATSVEKIAEKTDPPADLSKTSNDAVVSLEPEESAPLTPPDHVTTIGRAEPRRASAGTRA